MAQFLKQPSVKKKLLGEKLEADGVIQRNHLNRALEIQQYHGGKIGDIITAHGFARDFDVAKKAAENEGVAIAKSPDKLISNLVNKFELKTYIHLGCLPIARRGKVTEIAVNKITQELHEWARKTYGKHYAFVICSKRDLYDAISRNFKHDITVKAILDLWKKHPESSARYIGMNIAWQAAAFPILCILAMLVAVPDIFISGFIGCMNFFYLVSIYFKMLIFSVGYKNNYVSDEVMIHPRHYPMYTLLVPLAKEKEVVPALLNALRELEYPKHCLDVKLIVEEDDEETLKAIKSASPESFFHIIKVPYSYPQTKPKACNYALQSAYGEYLAIYDAEDRPDKKQLLRALKMFEENPELSCVQARLNYYNQDKNILTRFFSIEYACWFDFMLKGLERLGLPIPLGGTSNHFKMADLRKIMAWDPFNVTEDAELGIRMNIHGMKVMLLNSETLEEAPRILNNWLKQRTRWIKGYMQTYMVYMRSPLDLLHDLGLKNFLGFQLFIGGPSLIFLATPIVWVASLALYGKGGAELSSPHIWLFYFAMFNLISGLLINFIMGYIAAYRRGWSNMAVAIMLFPLYWLLHSVASFMAVYQLVTRPHFWNKTVHGA